MGLRSASIDDIWPEIESSVRATLTDPEELSADDMREACAAGEWCCAECDEGFLTFRVWVNPKTSMREFVIWFANSNTTAGAFARALPDLRKAAVDLGCTNIVWYTNKPAWLRLARQVGARVRNIELVVPVGGLH